MKFPRLVASLLFAVIVFSQSSFCQVLDNIQPDLRADPKSDVNAFAKYQAAIKGLLAQNSYDELERIAGSARDNKERFSGGYWKISAIYLALATPVGNESDGTVWAEHLAHLQQWLKMSPDSITARIALASAYVAHADSARGDGTGDTVTAQGWKVYKADTAEAYTLLKDLAKLSADPRTDYVMLQIAQNQGWETQQEEAIFEQAISREPTYRPYYRLRASYLLPQWYGKEGDIARFANDVYTRMGPVNGPIAYYEIAAVAMPFDIRVSLGKMKEGYRVSVQHYGETFDQLNQLAFLSYGSKDMLVMQDMLDRIGDNYVADSWFGHREMFDNARNMLVPPSNFGTEPYDALKEEMQSPAGESYLKKIQQDFNEKYSAMLAACRVSAVDDLRGFHTYIKLDNSGQQLTGFTVPRSAFSDCFGMARRSEGRPTYATPPHGDYWVHLVVQDH